MTAIIAPNYDVTNNKDYAMVPNCPNCGNNDTTEGSDGTLIIMDRYATSGYIMKCIACGEANWRFWIPQMDPYGCVTFNGGREPQNMKRTIPNWKPYCCAL